jgi:hypothetical protein
MRDVGLHVTLNDFWIEYPGSKGTQWITPTTGQTWKFAASSENPFEMPSPLQPPPANGTIVSEWFDPVTSYPTALMPFSPPASGYEVSMEGWPSPIADAYLGIGFTNSNVVTSNLTSAGSLWLRVRDLHEPGLYNYELRTDGMTGPVLATGTVIHEGLNRWAIRYDPSTSTVTLTVAGEVVGSFHAAIQPPRYVAFEGVGVLDDFVVRQ